MLVRWEGGAPPDKGGWFAALGEALGEEAGFYWVRFYREPGGWRFDLERHRPPLGRGPTFEQADESIALRVYTVLVESGKPIDPGWRPSTPSPVPATVRSPAPVVASEFVGATPRAPVSAPLSPPRPKRRRKRRR